MHNTYWWKNCWLNTIWVEWRPLRQTKLHVQETGIWLDDCGLLGASLDGLVGDDLLEAKFPYTQRNMLIAEAIKSPKFYWKDDRGNLYLHVWEDHAYCHQVQGELFFTNRKVIYFMVWTTEGTVALQKRYYPQKTTLVILVSRMSFNNNKILTRQGLQNKFTQSSFLQSRFTLLSEKSHCNFSFTFLHSWGTVSLPFYLRGRGN